MLNIEILDAMIQIYPCMKTNDLFVRLESNYFKILYFTFFFLFFFFFCCVVFFQLAVMNLNETR